MAIVTPQECFAEALAEYRVTMVFRWEDGAWKLLHRHADSLVHKEKPA